MLSQIVPTLGSNFIKLVVHKTVKNVDHAKAELAMIEQLGNFE
jgi:hypothetical protein